MKTRAFEPEVEDGKPPPRTEPAPYARTAIALVLSSWLVPLGMLVSLLRYTEDDPGTHALHRALTVASLALLGVGLGLAVRAIDRARKDARIRRRLPIAALVLGVVTPVVWTSELVLAFEMFEMREQLDAAAADAPAADATR